MNIQNSWFLKYRRIKFTMGSHYIRHNPHKIKYLMSKVCHLLNIMILIIILNKFLILMNKDIHLHFLKKIYLKIFKVQGKRV